MKKSKEWPRWHTRSQNKWDKIVEKTKAGEKFDKNMVRLGFYDLPVWTACGYCKEFDSCERCPLNQRKAIWERKEIPICDNYDYPLDTSIASLYVKEMNKSNPNRKKAIQLAKIVRDEITKDKPN